MQKKILVLLPDGVGLRNFAFSKFNIIAKESNFEIVYWNNSNFPLNAYLGLNEISFPKEKPSPISDLLKRARKRIELKLSYRKTKDKAYLSYIFRPSYKGITNFIKSIVVDIWVLLFSGHYGLIFTRKLIRFSESKSKLYLACYDQLKNLKPDLVFCTNQRPLSAIAPILAAQKLKVPTVSFIFSWDNLPKGMMVVDADYYFVWSNYMKKELHNYYSHVDCSKIFITGSPQFELHNDLSLLIPKEIFFETYELDETKKYICFSGDDVTTSPYDQFYLEDLAIAVRELNELDYNLGIIYRKCPVDFTGRHLDIINKYQDIINCIDPQWENLGNSWNQVMPLKGDNQILFNTVYYTDLVINIGSSMVFDFVSQNKPCLYINYNSSQGDTSKWNIEKIYKYLHFKSMPSNKSVYWINSKEDISVKLKEALEYDNESLNHTKNWFSIINEQPFDKASYRIIDSLKSILE